MKNRIEVFNSFRPVIPLWEDLNYAFPNCFEFIELEAKYREHVKREELPGKKFKSFKVSKKLNGVLYFLKASFHILRNKKEIRLIFTQPPLFFLFCYLIKKIRGDQYILHIMDVYPDIFFRVFPKTKFSKPLLNRLVIKGLKGAKKIMVIGRCMEELLIKKGVLREKIVYFPNFSGVHRNQYTESNNLSIFHIVYAGNIGFAHDLTTLISTAKKLEGSGLEVIIIGKGANFSKTKEFVLKSKANNVRLLNNVDNETFTHIIGNANMHFINLKEEFNGLIVPSKYYSALKLGIPVLYEGPKESEIFRDVVDNKMGCAIENRDSESMEETIRKLLNQSIKFNREKIIKHYNQQYAIEGRIKRYFDIITNHSS